MDQPLLQMNDDNDILTKNSVMDTNTDSTLIINNNNNSGINSTAGISGTNINNNNGHVMDAVIDNNSKNTIPNTLSESSLKSKDEINLGNTFSKQDSNGNTTSGGSGITSKFSWRFFLFWILGLSVHFVMATNQVFSRYLQHEGEKNQQIPVLSLLIVGNFVAFVAYSPRILYKFARPTYFKTVYHGITKPSQTFHSIKKHYKFLLLIALYQLSIVMGSSLREISVKYTSATFVQLVMLSNPFLIYFLGIFIFKTEKFSILDLITCIFTVGGSVIVILSSSTSERTSTFHWKWIPDMSQIGKSFKWPDDFIGIIIAFISCFFFSMKMNSVNKLSPNSAKPVVESNGTSLSTETTIEKEILIKEEEEGSKAIVTEKDEEDLLKSTTVTTSLISKPLVKEEEKVNEIIEVQSSYFGQNLQETDDEEDEEEDLLGSSDLRKPLLHNDHTKQQQLDQQPINNANNTLDNQQQPTNIEEGKEITTETQQQQHEKPLDISPEDLFIIQKVLLFSWPIIPSVILEDWSVYKNLTAGKWVLLISFCLLNRLFAAVAEIYAAKEIGSGNYGIMFPLRIVIGLFLASLMLHEWIDNLFSIFGCLVVIVSIVVFTAKKHT
ncbi:hypothetical protein ABK040_003819 [Willaertia magna]